VKIGYARVSTREQNSISQRQLLAEAGCEEIYIDEGVSGKSASRPELDKALGRLRRGDTLVITRLSRLSSPGFGGDWVSWFPGVR
jgi:DNA invertase Pin-like site-specific DNA recombinase